MVIDRYTPRPSGCLLGYLDVTLPSGLSVRGIALFSKDGERWTKLPTRRWKDRSGEWREEPVLEIADRERKDIFDRTVLAALDRHEQESH